MPVSPALAARRALVKVLLTLAALYSVGVELTREAADEVVTKAYKRVALKVVAMIMATRPSSVNRFKERYHGK